MISKKLEKALKYGVPLIDERTLIEMCGLNYEEWKEAQVKKAQDEAVRVPRG